jgi:hypothetical protein
VDFSRKLYTSTPANTANLFRRPMPLGASGNELAVNLGRIMQEETRESFQER